MTSILAAIKEHPITIEELDTIGKQYRYVLTCYIKHLELGNTTNLIERIALDLDIPKGTVKSRMHRGRKYVQEQREVRRAREQGQLV